MAPKRRTHDEDDQEEEAVYPAVKKRPGARVLKRPAAEESDVDDEVDAQAEGDEGGKKQADDDDEAGTDDGVKKRSSQRIVKRPAVAEDEGDGEEDEEDEDANVADASAGVAEAAARSVKQGHRAAVLAVKQKQRLIDKLEKQKEILAKNTKGVNSELRQAQKELEDLKGISRSKGRAVATVNARKNAKLLEKKAQQASRAHLAAQKNIKATRKRIVSAEASWKAAKDKLEVAESNLRQQQARFADAEQKCQALRAKKQYVSDPGDDSDWKFSHKSAPLSPGVAAAKALHLAKEALAKGKGEWKRLKDLADLKEKKFHAAKERLKSAREKQQAADSVLNQTKAGKSSEPKSMKKVVKSMKKSKPKVMKTAKG